MILYESVHRVAATLDDLCEAVGPGRQAVVARELTKLHETFYAGTLDAIRASLAADSAGEKGEITLVIAGAGEEAAPAYEIARVAAAVGALLPPGKAAGLVAEITSCSREEAYAAVGRSKRRDPAS
jgi:16S rRNA (cytidine1402-2'-O)-methyltransferase